MKSTGSLFILALLLVGCVTTSPAVVPVTPLVIYVTPEPVRATPTPTPTPRPTATPFVLDTAWLDYLTQQSAWLDTFLADSQAIASADTSDMGGWRRIISTAYDNARDVQRELRGITPSACFSDLYDAQEEFIDTYTEALRLIDYGLTPPVTLRDMQAGSDMLGEATDLLADATALMDEVTC